MNYTKFKWLHNNFKTQISCWGIHPFRGEKCLLSEFWRPAESSGARLYGLWFRSKGRALYLKRSGCLPAGCKLLLSAARLSVSVLRADSRHQSSHRLSTPFPLPLLTSEGFHRVSSAAQASRWCGRHWLHLNGRALGRCVWAACCFALSYQVCTWCTGSCSGQGNWTATEMRQLVAAWYS